MIFSGNMFDLFNRLVFLFLIEFVHMYSSFFCDEEGDLLLLRINPIHRNELVEIVLYLYFGLAGNEIGVE